MLLSGNVSTQLSYYEILSVKENASYDEIRSSYKAAALDCHPDKLKVKSEEVQDNHLLHEGFLRVQEAWQVLGNPASRAIYDRELSASRLDLMLAEEVGLEEMMMEYVGDALELSRPCRCGDTFMISSAELHEMGFCLKENGRLEFEGSNAELSSVVIPCFSCSLRINLIIDADS